MWPFKKQEWEKANAKLMNCYYASYGTQSAIADINKSDISFEKVLIHTLKLYFPQISDTDAKNMVEKTKLNCLKIHNDQFVVRLIKNNVQSNFHEEIIESMRKFFDPNKRPILLKSLISDVIEREYGPEEKAKYIIAILEQKVK